MGLFGGAPAHEQTYLFIDGGHLLHNYNKSVSPWFGSDGEIDIEQVKNTFQAHKCFYYDSVDDIQKPNETKIDFEARVAKQEAFFTNIQEIPGSHVRLGSMTGTRKNKRQKQVDILLTVDVLSHAIRQNMGTVVILTGDQDFVPVARSLVDMGLFVTVAGDAKQTSKELIRTADNYYRLGFTNYFLWSKARLRNDNPVPAKILQKRDLSKYAIIKKGTIAGIPSELRRNDEGSMPIYFAIQNAPHSCVDITFHDLARLELFCTLELGEVNWS